jgi:thymidylate synthase
VNGGFLDMSVNMRSVDVCLGLPTDIALYAALLIAIARHTDYKPGTLTFMLGDTHMYANHVRSFKEQALNHPMIQPKYKYNGHNLFFFHPDLLLIENYESHAGINYELN